MEPVGAQHNYQTRIRQNITIKPSARNRADSDPSAVVPPDQYPPFPPPNVVLHPDDASNKVFLAVARSFVSVDNRAMTIKDIAERASRYGLVCQNLSAAAQAVTTYLRTHKARCDKQQDHPLLLSHTLSGTPADDDLLPALFSRSGGDSHPLQNRLTNFRKGTAVWYLSRATGVPCPFTRSGIRLCDYVFTDSPDPSNEPLSRRDRNRQDREQLCGQKRKRPLRGCVARASGSDNERPPKVKLTLRLKPLARPSPSQPDGSTSAHPIDVSDSYDSDDSMSADSSNDESQTAKLNKEDEEEEPWSLPPYPRRSISIPCYTPATEYYPTYPSPTPYKEPFRRSPSVPFATPPPDSDDEADDFHVTMARIKDYSDQEDDHDIGWDADLDSEGEGETVWESPGPRSPSAPLIQPTQVAVKEEPRDVQGMLAAWEDFDTNHAVAEVLSKALEVDARPKVKLEPLDPWDWDANHAVEWASEETARVKQEDFAVDSLFPPSPLSPLSSLASQFAAFSYSDTQPGSEADDDLSRIYPTVRPRARTVPAPSPFLPTASSSSSLSPPPLTRQSVSSSSSREPSVPSTALVTLLQSMSVDTSTTESCSNFALPPPTPCVSPLQTRCQPTFSQNRPVVVTTCQPCKPAISATQIEDISVYQMMLGAFQLLRRIDTDFVNLSPILAIAGMALSASMIPPNAMVVTKGSPEVSGTWVPLAAAQAYVQEHLTGDGKFADGEMEALQVFLSDKLVELFPPALQDFHRTIPTRGLLNQFGRHFASTLQAARWETLMEGGAVASGSGSSAASASASSSSSASASVASPPPLLGLGDSGAPFVPLPQQHSVSAVPSAFVMGLALGERHVEKEEVPLSATEQQLFHELCVIPDWDKETTTAGGDQMVVDSEMPSKQGVADEPLPPPPTPTTAVPLVVMSPTSTLSESPLSSPMSSPTIPYTVIRTKPAIAPLALKPAERSDRPLRRSKRVADALAGGAQPPTQQRLRPQTSSRARSRKGGSASRNSLS
ncbi:hypothetical protein BDZ97DRAFT_1904331 [Flammula alnicola]|nr:hypothetical protein BDZ97DRAFT_1904331 [Flammula alnicola]